MPRRGWGVGGLMEKEKNSLFPPREKIPHAICLARHAMRHHDLRIWATRRHGKRASDREE